MTAVKTSEIDAFVARPSPAYPIVLVLGPDAGLVRERVEALIGQFVDDPQDPFALARLDSDALADQPSRLVEEAHTVPLFGGRRAVWVKAGSRSIAPAVENLIAAPPIDARVVIEAGDLKRNAPLRTICERARSVAVLVCYADSERDLTRLIDEEVRAANLKIAPDARAALQSLIGGDRQASRGELRKLTLYCRGHAQIDLDDVMAVVTDASNLGIDGLIDAAFAGKTAELEQQVSRSRSAGAAVGSVMFAAQRQVAMLHKARLAVDRGADPTQAVERMIPPVNFRRKAAVEAALRLWSTPRLERVMADLATAALDSRRQSALAETIVQRALLSIAANARRRD